MTAAPHVVPSVGVGVLATAVGGGLLVMAEDTMLGM